MIIYRTGDSINYEDIDGTNRIRCVDNSYAEFDDLPGDNIRISIYRNQGRGHKNFFRKEFLISEIFNRFGGVYGTTYYDVVSGFSGQNIIQVDTNNAAGDAFGRLRTSTPFQLFDSKELDGSHNRIWDEKLAGNGSTTQDVVNSQWILSAPDNGSFAIRQTKQRFSYQAGKSQLALLTGVIPTITDTRCSIGLAEENQATNTTPFEIYNGIYWQNANDGTT